jgi:hypothetical protein
MMNSEEYIESLMHEAEDWDNFVAGHWSQDLLDKPDALVAVIETKISRAVVAERRKIIERLSALAYFNEEGDEMISEFKNDLIALIKGENQ